MTAQKLVILIASFTMLMGAAISAWAEKPEVLEKEMEALKKSGRYADAADKALELVSIYSEERKLGSVTITYGKALEYLKLSGNRERAAEVAEEMGDYFEGFGKDFYQEADEAYATSIALYSEIGNEIKQAKLRIKRGIIYSAAHKNRAAIQQYELAYQLVKDKNKALEKHTASRLKDLYRVVENTAMAEKYDQIYETLTYKIIEDVNINQEKIIEKEKAIQKLQAIIESEDTLLHSEEIEKAKIELKKAEVEKKKLKENTKKLEKQLKSHEDEISSLEVYQKTLELKQENTKNTIIFSSVLVGLVLIFLILFLLIQRSANRKAKAQNVQLEQMNEEVNAQNDQLKTQNDEIERKTLEIKYQKSELEVEKNKSDELLLNILPVSIADELKKNGQVKPKLYELATVLFTDFKGFTHVAELLSPEELLEELNTCFSEFDDIIKRHKIEKIKTIGDAYMCAGGLPEPNQTNPVDAILAALEMNDFIKRRAEHLRQLGKPAFELRLGIHTGPLIAGVVGTNKFAYDIWGDAVNIASRMESSGKPGMVNVSGVTQALTDRYFHFTYRGKVEAKNKGAVDMYFVDGIKEYP